MKGRSAIAALSAAGAIGAVVLLPSPTGAGAASEPCAAVAWSDGGLYSSTGGSLMVQEAGADRQAYDNHTGTPPSWDPTGLLLSQLTFQVGPGDSMVPVAVVTDRTGSAVSSVALGSELYYPNGGIALPLYELVMPFAPDGRVSFLDPGALELRSVDTLTSSSIPLATGMRPSALVWSPEGTRIAWIAHITGGDRQVHVADADGSEVHAVGPPSASIEKLQWSGDDAVSWNGSTFDATTGAALPPRVGATGWWSPDGGIVATHVNVGDPPIGTTVLRRATGPSIHLPHGASDVKWSRSGDLVSLVAYAVRTGGFPGRPGPTFFEASIMVATTDGRWRSTSGTSAVFNDEIDSYPLGVPISPGIAAADVRLEVSNIVVSGQRTSMHVVVTNDGPCTAPDVTLPVPDLGDVYAMSTSGPNPIPTTGSGVEWLQLRLGDLGSGDTRTFELAVDVAAPGTPAAALIALDSPIADPTPDDAIALIEATPAPSNASFSDVPASNPFTGDISWAAHHGLTHGFDDGSFHPAAPVTRQAIAAMVWRLRGSPQGPFSDPELPAPFSDVAHDDTFASAIDWARWAELTGGYPDGGFHPTATVTRQSLVSMLWRLAGSPTGAPVPGYSDVPAGHPFHDAIAWATDAGITNGHPDGSFRPGGAVTRQAAAAWLTRWHAVVG